MKFLLSSVALVLCTVLCGQNSFTDRVNQNILTGNAQALAQDLSNNVSIELNGTEKIYSREKAKDALNTFFQRNEPKAFEVKHESEPNNAGNNFNIGILRTSNGAFRLTYLLKDGNQNNPKIRKIKLVKIVR